MSNTILIKEVNNNPVLFNVDNAVDEARLEALQAVKMAEEMAASVFGENAMYADNTTCIITDNPDNPAFPWDVAFDAAKIPEKPKRDTGTLAGIGMPSDSYIDIANGINTGGNNVASFTAPASGYAYISAYGNPVLSLNIINKTNGTNVVSKSPGTGNAGCILPVKKGDEIDIYYWREGVTVTDLIRRFYFAEGEL